MSIITSKVIKNKQFDEKTALEIITLHQQYFNLPDEAIINVLSHRDEVKLFYDKQTKELVGTVGIQWLHYKDFEVMYLGGIVIREDYLQYGLLSLALVRYLTKMIVRNPLKKRYVFTMATTPDAYRYFTKFRQYYPKPGKPIPEEMEQVFNSVLMSFCPENFEKKDGVYLTRIKDCPFELMPNTKHKAMVRKDKHARWFKEQVPEFIHGQQLVVGIELDGYVLKMVYDSYLKVIHHKKLFSLIPTKWFKTKTLVNSTLVVVFSTLLGFSAYALVD